jgi:hypothetical protein
VAIAAYWLGPYQDNPSILRHFAQTRELPQPLVRVALRQLLILANLGDFRWSDEFCDAAAIVSQLAQAD